MASAGMYKKNNNIFSRPVAFCSIMAALGTVMMLTGGLIPVFTYCSPLLASLLLIPVLFEYGSGKAWMVWVVTGALTLIIGIDKEAAFFYIFLAWYPIIKPHLDILKSKVLRFLSKILVFSAAVAAMYGLTCFVFRIDDIVNSFSAVRLINAAFLAALVLVMMLYDYSLAGIAHLYRTRLLTKLKK